MRVSLIVAAAENGVIGQANDLPWRLSDDLKHFKRLTIGHCMIMGRRTWDSIGRPLPKRRSIVITRDPEAFLRDLKGPAPDTTVASLAEALAAVDEPQGEVFITGGAQIYELALPQVDRLYLTRVHAHIAGDTYLPAIDFSEWALIDEQFHAPDDKNQYAFSLRTYDRRPGTAGSGKGS